MRDSAQRFYRSCMMKWNHSYSLHMLPVKLSKYIEEAPAVCVSAHNCLRHLSKGRKLHAD